MNLKYSEHWKKKKLYRKDIKDDMIEYAIQNSNELKDKYWKKALNAISRIPPLGQNFKGYIQKRTIKN